MRGSTALPPSRTRGDHGLEDGSPGEALGERGRGTRRVHRVGVPQGPSLSSQVYSAWTRDCAGARAMQKHLMDIKHRLPGPTLELVPEQAINFPNKYLLARKWLLGEFFGLWNFPIYLFGFPLFFRFMTPGPHKIIAKKRS